MTSWARDPEGNECCLLVDSTGALITTGGGGGAPSVPSNTAKPKITGTPAVGQTLHCSTGTWTQSPTGYTYQWKRGGVDISGATSADYILVAADGGTSITCAVTATNAVGSGTATSAAVNVPVPVQPPTNTAPPVISGSATAGSVLTCDKGSWSQSPTGYTYQWLRDGANISGQTGTTYTSVAGDVGTAISCRVTATNAGGSANAVSNAITVTAALPNAPANTTLPQVTGTAAVGQTLTCDNGQWTNTPTSYAHQWKRNGANISGATNTTYVLVAADGGTSISCDVTATNAGGSATASSNTVNVPVPVSPPVNTTAPAISGTAAVGSILTCDNGQWTNTPTGYTYQWQGNGADISGATSATYTLVAADGGTSVSCNVTASNSAGSATAASNVVSVPVPVQPPVNSVPPEVTGAIVVGSVLTCSDGTWSGSPTYAYQWTTDGTDIAGQTTNAYTSVAGDIGHAIGCTVTASNSAGSASANSDTVIVEDVPDTGGPWSPLNLPGLVAWFDVRDTATLTLNGTKVTQWNDKGPHGYHAVQGTAGNQPTYDEIGLTGGLPTLDFTYQANSNLVTPVPAGTFAAGLAWHWVLMRTDNARGSGLARIVSTFGAPYTVWGASAYIGDGTGQTANSVTSTGFSAAIYGLIIQTAGKNISDWNNGNAGVNKAYNGNYGDNATNMMIGGNSSGGTTTVSVSEVVLCPSMTVSDRQKLEGYLAHKWGLQGGLPANHPYKTAPP